VKDVRRHAGPPESLLEHVADAMLNVGEEVDGLQMIVLLDTPETGQIAYRGYADDLEAVAAMLMHLRAMLNANGKDIGLLPLGRG